MATINVNNYPLQSKLNELYSFPCIPKELGANPLDTYRSNLKVGHVLACNDDSPKLLIHTVVRTKNNSSILVMCEREGRLCEAEGFMPWLIVEITFKNGLFFHFKVGSYFEKEDADEAFCIMQ